VARTISDLAELITLLEKIVALKEPMSEIVARIELISKRSSHTIVMAFHVQRLGGLGTLVNESETVRPSGLKPSA
jgi:hypothetical protein